MLLCFHSLTLPLQSVAFKSSGVIPSFKMLASTWRMISSSWFRDARNSVVINGIFCMFILRFSREIRPLIFFTIQWMLKWRTHTKNRINWIRLNNNTRIFSLKFSFRFRCELQGFASYYVCLVNFVVLFQLHYFVIFILFNFLLFLILHSPAVNAFFSCIRYVVRKHDKTESPIFCMLNFALNMR